MAQVVKLKRSAVAGKVPSTGSLELGELALNTYDGRVFFEKSGSNGESVEQIFTTNAEITGSLLLYKSGSTVVDIQGSQGQLFSITDSLSGSLMSVNDISGLPIFEVFSDDKVVMGEYGQNTLYVSASKVGILTSSMSNTLTVGGNVLADSFTGSFSGDASGLTSVTASALTIGLDGLTDVTTLSESEGDLLVYNNSTSLWENKKLLSGSYSISGSLTIVDNDATVHGLTVGRGGGSNGCNTVLGASALSSNTTGVSNTAVGYFSLFSNNIGQRNTALGRDSLRYNTTGNYNTAVGYQALLDNTTGYFNNAFGDNALANVTTGVTNVGVGYGAGFLITTGCSNVNIGVEANDTSNTSNVVAIGSYALTNNSANNLVAVGHAALYSNTTGANNTAVGYQSLYSNTIGQRNTGLGYLSLSSNTTGNYNTAVGFQALLGNTTGQFNNAFGDSALGNVTSGTYNIGIGSNAGANITSGDWNVNIGAYANDAWDVEQVVAIGHEALTNNCTGYLVAVGHQALYSNTWGDLNTAVGHHSLFCNTIGSYNTGLGGATLYYNTTGNYNTAVGYGSLALNTTGVNNTAVGYTSLFLNTTGSYNTAVGYAALYDNTTGRYNSAFGDDALVNVTTGLYNVGVGYQAGFNITTGSSNINIGYVSNGAANTSNVVAIGHQALTNNSANNLVAVGHAALAGNTTGASNTAVGYLSLNANTIGQRNAAVGNGALFSNTTGDQNTAVGNQALYCNTTGRYNTAFGDVALIYLTTGDQNTAIGQGAGSTVTTGTNLTLLGYDAEPSSATATNEITLGDTNVTKLRIPGIGAEFTATDSIITGSLTTTGDLTVEGTITAREFKTELVSASIVYQSGSTKFGDTSDDVHSFSGSLRVTGSGDHYISDGNVGIGTDDPIAKLDIVTGIGEGANNESNSIRLRHQANSGNAMTLLMGVNNCGIGGTNQGYGYLQGAYWGGGTNPIILNPKGGNVGINSAQARVALDVNGDQLLKLSGTNQLLRKIGFTGNGIYASHPTYMGGYADNGPWSSGIALVFGTIRSGDVSSSTGIERMRISSDGNVGIGTTSPSHRLDVSGSGNFTDGLTVTGSLTTTGDLTVEGTITAREFKTELVSASIVYQSGSTKFGDTLDDVHSFTGSLLTSGSIGINRTSLEGFDLNVLGCALIQAPDGECTKLEFRNPVNSDRGIRIVGNATSSGASATFFIEGFGPGGVLRPAMDWVPNSNLTHNLGDSSTVWDTVFARTIRGRNNSAEGILCLRSGTSSNPITFNIDTTEYMRVGNTGNVGIGTTSPSYKLDVSGSGNFTDGLTVTG